MDGCFSRSTSSSTTQETWSPCTPPVGTCLFIGCKVGETTIAKVTRPLLPFYEAMILALTIITYVPSTSLWLPVQTDLLKQEEVDKLDFLNAEQHSSR